MHGSANHAGIRDRTWHMRGAVSKRMSGISIRQCLDALSHGWNGRRPLFVPFLVRPIFDSFRATNKGSLGQSIYGSRTLVLICSHDCFDGEAFTSSQSCLHSLETFVLPSDAELTPIICPSDPVFSTVKILRYSTQIRVMSYVAIPNSYQSRFSS